MNTIERQSVILSLLRAEFQRERASDFALLRRAPSTGAQRFLDYFSTLKEADQDALADALSDRALLTFFPYETQSAYQKGNVAYKRYTGALVQMNEWKYACVRSLRGALSLSRQTDEVRIPPDILKRVEAIKPVKSTETRKVVKLALSQAFAPLKVTHDSGEWLYEGHFQGRPISIVIDYSNSYFQLDYGIRHPYQETAKIRLDLSYEGLLGIAAAAWDCLEQANLDQSAALLKDMIIHCHRFVQSLPSPYMESGV